MRIVFLLTFFNKFDLRLTHDVNLSFLNQSDSLTISLEIATNSTNWQLLTTFTGTQLDWKRTYIDISSYVGKNVTIKFNITAPNLLPSGGWWMDNVIVISDPFIYGVILLAINNETKIDPGEVKIMKLMLVNIMTSLLIP